jgi:DNA-binding transcriptional LysR family regulator
MFETAHDMVQRLECAGHLQSDEIVTNAVDHRRHGIEGGRLVNVMPKFPPTRLPINVVYLSRRNMPLRVRAALDFLVDAVREDPLMASLTDDMPHVG